MQPLMIGTRRFFAYLTLFFTGLFLLGDVFFTIGQVVITQPAFPTSENEITLIFDLKLAQDNRAKGLLGKTTDVYLWSGAGSTADGNAFEFTPQGQTDFTRPFEPGRMTSLGNDRWSIKLTPRSYFGVPAGKVIKKLGLLLKSGDGRAQTEDLFVTIYDNSQLRARFVRPAENSFFVDAGQPISILGVASRASQLSLTLDGVTLQSGRGDSLSYQHIPTGEGRRTVIFSAQDGNQVASDTFYFTVAPQPAIAPLPAGMKDGINYLSETSVLLSLFAPSRKFVHAIGEMTDWLPLPSSLMKRTPDGNRYWIQIDNLTPGKEYAFQYLIDGTITIGDPYADKILDPNNDRFITAATYPQLKAYPAQASGIVSVFQTAQKPYAWKVPSFQRPKDSELVIYELLVRDFVETRRYTTVADSLPYLKRMGVNALELMPIMEFAGNDSWGYNPIYHFAPDKAYGTKDALKELIDRSHANGIAVILDIVLNQADYENPYVKMYWNGSQPSADNPYFNQQATHPFNVFFDYNHEQKVTQDYVDRVCEYWLKEYKVDGFRFDLSKGFTQKNSGTNVGAWSAYDDSRVRIWKRIYDKIRSYDPTAYVILEHFADNQEERELANYGMLVWGNANFDYRRAAAGENRSFNGLSYQLRNWDKPNLIGYMESHDEERIMFDLKQTGRVQGSYSIKEEKTALERAKLAAAFFFPIPGPKLLWQFGEYGYDISIDQGGRTSAKPVRWNYLQQTDRRNLLSTYSAIINLRNTYPAFKSTNFTLDVGAMVKRIQLNSAEGNAFVIGNFDVQTVVVPAKFSKIGTWYDFFTGQASTVSDVDQSIVLQPGEFHIFTSTPVATPAAGIVPWSGTISSVTSLPAVAQAPMVYPNPGKQAVNLRWVSPYQGDVRLELTDLSGRAIQHRKVEKRTENWTENWTLSSPLHGVYLLKIQTSTESFVRKVILE